MWAPTFDQRLREWQCLRDRCSVLPREQCLFDINQWWLQAPWSSYYLHWHDRSDWPGPWQLLNDNIFCSISRALGMIYTLSLIGRRDLQDVTLIETDSDNLVIVDTGKYVLNWDSNAIVNINPGTMNPQHRITLSEINQLIL